MLHTETMCVGLSFIILVNFEICDRLESPMNISYDWARGPYGGMLVDFSFYVFMDRAAGETHVEKENEANILHTDRVNK